jgi:hypothetical protein
MRIPGVNHRRLMEESEARIAAVAREGTPGQALIAHRLLDDTRLYQRWEAEHDRLMRTVAGEARGLAQARALRRASFGLIHRKAMFEYLRQQRITGRDRHAVFALVHGEHHDYATAVIQEHGNYVRSACSLMCSQHIGLRVIRDQSFREPLSRYEQLYADYFRAFCGTALSGDQYNEGDTLRTLLPYLKQQLSKLRRAILALPQEPDTGFDVTDLQVPAANTQRMYQPFQAAS